MGIHAGVDVMRLNASHGTQDDHARRVKIIREEAAKAHRPIAILLDLQGPKIRLGKFAGGSKGFTAADIGVWQGDFAPVFSVGASLDYNIDTSFALRVSPSYIGTTFGSTMQNSKALNVGIVYRFGKAK